MIKFIYRLIINLFLLIGICIPLEIIGWFILLPVVFLYSKGRTPLPSFLKWFDNADQYVGRDTSTYFAVCDTGNWNKYTWLAWRNPLNYFGYSVLGVDISSVKVLLQYGNPNVGNTSQEGLYHQELVINDKVYYQYYYVKKWSPTKCMRFRLGWKFNEVVDGQIGQNWVQWGLTIQPYIDYTGV